MTLAVKMMQQSLIGMGYDLGPAGADGVAGAMTRAAVMAMLEDGPDTRVTDADLRAFADKHGLAYAQVKAVCQIEANGGGFFDGLPKILPEPHRFSKATGHVYDATHPDISYPKWGERPYPATQAARYDVLWRMIQLDPDAGFASASYGKFQIMGENHDACGYASPLAFAYAMSRDESTQLMAFGRFLKSTGLLAKLRACGIQADSCRPFCAGYNGTAYVNNNYHTRLAAAIKAFGGS